MTVGVFEHFLCVRVYIYMSYKSSRKLKQQQQQQQHGKLILLPEQRLSAIKLPGSLWEAVLGSILKCSVLIFPLLIQLLHLCCPIIFPSCLSNYFSSLIHNNCETLNIVCPTLFF